MNNLRLYGGNEITNLDAFSRMINLMSNATNTICFHHNDMDGKSAAMVLYLLGVKDFHLCDYNKNLIDASLCKDKDIIIVDYSVTIPDIELLTEARSITLIDHHISTTKIVSDLNDLVKGNKPINFLIDTGKCGAMLTYEYYGMADHSTQVDKEVSDTFIKLVDDYDRWVKADIRSDYLNTYLYNCGQNYVGSQIFIDLFKSQEALDKAIEFGKRFYDNAMQKNRIIYDAFAKDVEINGLKFKAIEGYGNSQLFPDEVMYDESYAGVIVYHKAGDYYQFSLYSANSKYAMNEIAESFIDDTGRPGGGHRAAAGFRTKEKLF